MWDLPLAFVERVKIGTIDEDGPAAFGRIRAVEIDGYCRIYVADTHAGQVRVFSAEGEHVRSLGGRGQGPGELLDPAGLAWRDEATLWIVDYDNWRYSVYDSTGAHVIDLRRPGLGSLWPWPGAFTAAGLVEARVMTGAYRLVLVDPEFPEAPADTFPYAITGVPTEYWEPSYFLRRGSTTWRVPVPFTAGYQWALDREGNIWGGDTRESRLVHRSLAGDTLLIINRPTAPVLVSAAERAAAIDELGEFSDGVDPDRIPAHRPFFRKIIPSDDGSVWLLREGESGQWLIEIIRADGKLMGTVPIDARPDVRVRPVVRGRNLVLVTLNDLDVQFVSRYELRAGVAPEMDPLPQPARCS